MPRPFCLAGASLSGPRVLLPYVACGTTWWWTSRSTLICGDRDLESLDSWKSGPFGSVRYVRSKLIDQGRVSDSTSLPKSRLLGRLCRNIVMALSHKGPWMLGLFKLDGRASLRVNPRPRHALPKVNGAKDSVLAVDGKLRPRSLSIKDVRSRINASHANRETNDHRSQASVGPE